MIPTGPSVSAKLSLGGGLATVKILADSCEIQSFFHDAKALIAFSQTVALIGHRHLTVDVNKR